MVQIKRIGVLSAAKMMGILTALGGLLAGAVLSLMAVIGVSAGSMNGGPGGGSGPAGLLFGLGAIICLPLVYGAIGFVVGAVEAFVYNFAAGLMGGIEIELGE